MTIYSRHDTKQHFRPLNNAMSGKRTPSLLKLIYKYLKRRNEEVVSTTPPAAL